MILPTTLLLGALGYLFYNSKKELSIDHHNTTENQKENDDLPEPFGPIKITFSEYAILKFKSLITLESFLKQLIFFASNQNLFNTKTYYSKI